MRFLINTLPSEPFAVALSGGGDSTALVHALSGYKPLVLIVDHGLRNDSHVEAQAALDFVHSLGLSGQILTWEHGGVLGGIQAKARLARYTLLGAACRARGIKHLITGHTQDDQAETVLMRIDRYTGWRGAAGIAPVSYAPLWPALAGVSVWRPLLETSRAEIRQYLFHHTLPFVDDPSNENRDFARIQARDRLSARPMLRADMLALSRDMRAGREAENKHLSSMLEFSLSDVHGGFHVSKRVAPQLLGLAVQAAGGGGAQIDQAKIRSLHRRLTAEAEMTATLMGAKITKRQGGITIIRNPGAARGRANKAPIESIDLPRGLTLWDGRIWIKTARDELRVTSVAGYVASLPKFLQKSVRDVPSDARSTLPLIWKGSTPIWAGLGGPDDSLEISRAVSSRLRRNLLPNPSIRVNRM